MSDAYFVKDDGIAHAAKAPIGKPLSCGEALAFMPHNLPMHMLQKRLFRIKLHYCVFYPIILTPLVTERGRFA